MNRRAREQIWKLARRLLGAEEVKRLKQLPLGDTGFGYDPFGMERETIIATYLVGRMIYRHYFRVDSEGHENIPTRGRAILVSNHSGAIPIDGAMIGVDLISRLNPPRVIRAAADNFVAGLPFLGVYFNRLGQISGTRLNMMSLLERDELVAIFPEGTRGIGKGWRRRYQLQEFTVGFVELALRARAPVIPTAVIGAEEQFPMIGKWESAGRLLGIPWIPITPTFPLLGPLGALPYPSKYHILYGEPIRMEAIHGPEAASDPRKVRDMSLMVRERVAALIAEGLKRPHGFTLATSKGRLGHAPGKKLLQRFVR